MTQFRVTIDVTRSEWVEQRARATNLTNCLPVYMEEDRTRRQHPPRLPREVLVDLDPLLSTVATAPPDTLVEVDGIPTRWDAIPQRHPQIYRHFTSDWMRSFVLAEVARVATVSDSTDYLAARSHGPFTDLARDVLTVQHRLSGLRATFFWDNAEKIGRALAKSYSIPSIDPNRTLAGEGLQAVDEWGGLGTLPGST